MHFANCAALAAVYSLL